METLKLGQSLETREAQVLLDPTLKPGKYRMQLRVVSSGGVSDPAELRIVVRERVVLDPRVPVPPVIRIDNLRVTPATPVISRVDPQALNRAGALALEPAKATPAPKPAPKPKPKPAPKPKPKPKPPGKPKRK